MNRAATGATCRSVHRDVPTPSGARADLPTRCLSALCTLMVWTERRRQRRQLLALAGDADFLHDVGLSRADALREAHRPFWRR